MTWALLLLQTSLRNIFSSFLNVVIGLIILVGTFLFVVGGSLVNSIDKSMSRSIIGSVAGNAQVYQASSTDSPSLFEQWQIPDLDPIPDFGPVKKTLLSHPNVKAVVPEGINTAIVVYGNTVDQILEKLRKAETPATRQPKERIESLAGSPSEPAQPNHGTRLEASRQVRSRKEQIESLAGSSSEPAQPNHGTRLEASRQVPSRKEQIESLKAHVRQMITVIQTDMGKLDKMAAKGAVDPQSYQDLAKASSNAFWAGFDKDPFEHLEFLENKIAYLVPDSDQIFFSYVGTDLDAFSKSFDRMQIVDGRMVPPKHRGILLSKYVYENEFKLKAASRLDKIHEGVVEKNKKIAKDPDLQDLVKQNRQQTREIVLQLDPLSAKKAVGILQAALGSKETDLPKLLASFFDTNDANFLDRYKVFYDQLAPLVELYRLKPGDTLTIKAYTKTGFVEAVNVKVYGTFQFKGLEKSNVAGAASLMDLMSFRDLYGYVTPEKMAETQAIQKAAGVKFTSRDKAENELFGSAETVVQETKQKRINEKAEMGKIQRADIVNREYTQDEIDNGVVMGSAILLKDPAKLKETMKDLQDLCDKENLGLKVIDWQKAAGNLGQFVLVAKFILYFATFIIFVVALVIINNAVVMATLQRVREIGTMRAIGARRGFVLAMVLTETMVLGLAFGTVGSALGGSFALWLGHSGVPAANEFLYFFFSGPRLFPDLSIGSIIGAFWVVLIVTCISAMYPAVMATRVSPIQAMASED